MSYNGQVLTVMAFINLRSKVQPLTQVSRPPPHLWTNMKTWLQNPFQAPHPDQGPNPSLYQDKTMTRLWLIVCPFTPTSTTWWWTTTLRSSRWPTLAMGRAKVQIMSRMLTWIQELSWFPKIKYCQRKVTKEKIQARTQDQLMHPLVQNHCKLMKNTNII